MLISGCVRHTHMKYYQQYLEYLWQVGVILFVSLHITSFKKMRCIIIIIPHPLVDSAR